MFNRLSLPVLAAGALLLGSPAFASFHLMQIEQVIGGVGGNTSIQAIQLRMRAPTQGFVSQGRIIARDATGANPILIKDLTTDVIIPGNTGDHVLIVSPLFATTFPSPAGDFTMTNIIPASYLAGGKLTWEDDLGTIYWSLAWGTYSGTNTGNPINGTFGTPFASPLPSATGQALRFTGAAAAPSANNATDYAITAGNATFTNNAGASGSVPVELQDFKVE